MTGLATHKFLGVINRDLVESFFEKSAMLTINYLVKEQLYKKYF